VHLEIQACIASSTTACSNCRGGADITVHLSCTRPMPPGRQNTDAWTCLAHGKINKRLIPPPRGLASGLFDQAAARGFPSTASAFYGPQSYLCLYWSAAGRLLTTRALMLQGLETVQTSLSSFPLSPVLSHFFTLRTPPLLLLLFFEPWPVLPVWSEGEKEMLLSRTFHSLIRRSSPRCIRCPEAQHIFFSQNKS